MTIADMATATQTWLAAKSAPVTEGAVEVPVDVTGAKPDMTDTLVEGVARETEEGPQTPVEGAEPVKAPEGEAEPDKASAGQPEAKATPPEKFRKADGTFAKAIKGEFNGQPFELPDDVLVPQKRGETVEMVPLAKVLAEGMMAKDYHAKRGEESAVVREAVAAQKGAEAESEVWKGIVKKLVEDPHSAARLAEDPAVQSLWADSNELAIAKARQTATTTAVGELEVRTAKASVEGWVQGLAGEFQGVDSTAVQQAYANYLMSPAAQTDPHALTVDRVRLFYQREADRLTGTQRPLLDKLAAMEKEIADLKGKKVVEDKNAQTDHAVKRAGAVQVLGAGGNTGGAVTAPKTGPVLSPEGKPMSLDAASKEFAKRYQ